MNPISVDNGGIEPIEIKKKKAGTVCQATDYGLLGVKMDESQTTKTRFQILILFF